MLDISDALSILSRCPSSDIYCLLSYVAWACQHAIMLCSRETCKTCMDQAVRICPSRQSAPPGLPSPSSPVRCSALGSTPLEQRLALLTFRMNSIIITIPCTAIVQLCQHYQSLIPITVATQNIHSHMCIVYQSRIRVAGVTYSLILVCDHISDCHCYDTYPQYYACVDQCILLSSFITIPLTGTFLHLSLMLWQPPLSQHTSTNIACSTLHSYSRSTLIS